LFDEMMAEPLGKKGSSLNDQPSLWDAILPSALLVLPDELARVDRLLDAPAFVAPFASFFDARIGRPSVPMETYLRMMFLARAAGHKLLRTDNDGLPYCCGA
jgi:IS5 family transposase